MELFVVRLAEDSPYLYGVHYNRPFEKTIHFAHEIDDFGKITDADAWRHITDCIAVLNLKKEDCLEIVKVSHGIHSGVSNIFPRREWNAPFVENIDAGDSIEIRFRGTIQARDTHCFQVSQVYVNLNEGEEYRFGSETHGFGYDYDNRITCEFTHYVYFAKAGISLPTHFLTNTPKFPLVAAVARADCKEVVVKRYSNTGHPNVLTIWKHGNAFEMPQQLTIFSRDVIEIRLLKQNNKHEEQHDDNKGNKKKYYDDKGENTDESEKGDGPDEDESSGDEGGSDCTICFTGTREVVMKPCHHCCVCTQ